MNLSRRALLACPALLAPLAAQAQRYPSRAVEITVPYAPGGASDIIVRILAPALQTELGGSMVVLNRPGANTAIAAGQLARSPADGHSIMLADAALLLNVAVKATSPGYDLDKDFTLISLVGTSPLLLFTPAAGSRDLTSFLARGRAGAGLNIANAGSGSLGHLAGELLQLQSRATIVNVPYRGSGPALNETMAGQVDATFTSSASGMPGVKSGMLNALAVASARRMPDFPEVPTFAELGVPGMEVLNWWGLIGPAGMDDAVVARIAAALSKAMALPVVQERFSALGINPDLRQSAQFRAMIQSDLAQWRRVVREANISVD